MEENNFKPNELDFVIVVAVGCVAYTGYRILKSAEKPVVRAARKFFAKKKTTDN